MVSLLLHRRSMWKRRAAEWNGHQSRRGYRPQIELLENRLAPATHTWTGAVSNLWSNDNNWTGGAPRVDLAADLVFPAGAANLTNINDLNLLTIQTITYTGSGYTTTGIPISIVTQNLSSTIAIDPAVTGADSLNLNLVFGPNS